MLHQIYLCSKRKQHFVTACLLFYALCGYAQGCLFDPVAAAKQPVVPVRPHLGTKFMTFSYKKEFMPPVGDQRDCNSCTAWACSYYGLTLQEAHRFKQPAEPYSPYYVCEVTKRCGKGMFLEETVAALQTPKLPRISATSPNCDSDPSKPIPQVKLSKLYQVEESDSPETKKTAVDNLMKQLTTYLNSDPVILILRYHEELKKLKSDIMVPVDGLQNTTSYHAVCVVGYNNSPTGYIEIVNSWGENWGDKGFAKIKKEHIQSLVAAAYTFQLTLK